MYKVAVLMSTYNGEKYLREQIDSVLEQDKVDVTLYIRDDGSSDGTVSIIEEYLAANRNIKLTKGKNVGVGNSFMQLVYDVPGTFDYYAFADQDDVWLKEKLQKAIEKIDKCVKSVLYCSNQILVDKDLKKIGMRYTQDPNISYKQIMCQNKISGCTMVWNPALHKFLADENRRPDEELLKKRIHDVWVAMVCSVIGKIKYDRDSYICYRQHEYNVVGVKKASIVKQWIKKLKDPSMRNGRSSLCREVYEKFGNDIVSESIRKQLAVYAYYKNNRQFKKILYRDKSLLRCTNEKKLEFKMKVLFNLI